MKNLTLDTSWGALRLAGGSRAGEGSLLVLPQLRLALDAGRPARALVPMDVVAVSHGHLDHLLGVPAWASQRKLQGMPGGTVLVPATLAPAVTQLLALCAAMEGGEPYDVGVRGVGAEDVVALRTAFELHFFPTTHWVDTLGCRVDWVRHRLRPELAECPPDEIRARREAGEIVTEIVRTPLLAYLADTGPGVFSAQPWLADVEVLILECTFLRPGDRERALRFGHMHLDDLRDIAPGLRGRHLVLTHLSRRHRLAAGSRQIHAALAEALSPQLHLLNVEWD